MNKCKIFGHILYRDEWSFDDEEYRCTRCSFRAIKTFTYYKWQISYNNQIYLKKNIEVLFQGQDKIKISKRFSKYPAFKVKDLFLIRFLNKN